MTHSSIFEFKTRAGAFLRESLTLVLPMLLWLFLCRGFFLHELELGGTGRAYYLRIKYFLDSMSMGVYPQWNPFVAWGSPDLLDMRILGDFNPFLYIIVFLKFLGMADYPSYLCYMASYYFLGLVALYLLVKQIAGDRRIAWAAYALMLFSSLSMSIFSENVLPYMFVPGIWFFYFLTGFARQPARRFLLGMTFCVMIMVTTYIPFYFLTIFLFFLTGFLLAFQRRALQMGTTFVRSLFRFRWTTFFCVFSAGLAAVPSGIWHRAVNSGNYLINFRHAGAPDQDFISIPLQDHYHILTWFDLFDGVKYTGGLVTCFFYIPYFLYLIVLLSLVTRANRRIYLLFFTGFSIFLIALAKLTPVYPFLYKHIFFFRSFRNLFFFYYLCIPIIIIFAGEQLRIFLSLRPGSWGKKVLLSIWIILCHGAFAGFLYTRVESLWTARITIAASLLFFLLNLWGQKSARNSIALTALISLILLAEPVELYGQIFHDWKKDKPFIARTAAEWQRPQFSFSRPRKDMDPGVNQAEGYAGIDKVMKDSSGFIEREYIGTPWSFLLHNQMDPTILQDYVQHKFYAYDDVRVIDSKNPDIKALETALAQKRNIAFVFTDAAIKPASPSFSPAARPLVMTGKSEQLEVISFGLNFIKFRTQFPGAKFLVYNDSYHPAWRAVVNGKKAPIWQANIAFKGLWLEPGANMVELRYGNAWLNIFYIFLVAYFFLFFCLLVVILTRGGVSPWR